MADFLGSSTWEEWNPCCSSPDDATVGLKPKRNSQWAEFLWIPQLDMDISLSQVFERHDLVSWRKSHKAKETRSFWQKPWAKDCSGSLFSFRNHWASILSAVSLNISRALLDQNSGASSPLSCLTEKPVNLSSWCCYSEVHCLWMWRFPLVTMASNLLWAPSMNLYNSLLKLSLPKLAQSQKLSRVSLVSTWVGGH